MRRLRRVTSGTHFRGRDPALSGIPEQMQHSVRLRKLRQQMKVRSVPGLLVSHLPDVRYLCGFTGSNAYLCITPARACLFTDGRYTAQAQQETQAARIRIAPLSARDEACQWLNAQGSSACAFDPEATTVAQLVLYRKALPAGRRGFFKPLATPLISEMRLLKDEDELGLMKEAAQLTVDLFHALLPELHPGMRETKVAALLEQGARERGAEGMSFATIVASGLRSALPHGHASTQRLPRNGFITLDFGVILNGYCSDMTRTVFMGKSTARQRFTYDAVREAQQAAVSAVGPGVSCGVVDEAARSILRQAGVAEHFTHSTGHGVGLEIHESPRIAAKQTHLLEAGMVITIEPGVYFPGEFGVRIEDMVAVTQKGGLVMTPASTGWTQL